MNYFLNPIILAFHNLSTVSLVIVIMSSMMMMMIRGPSKLITVSVVGLSGGIPIVITIVMMVTITMIIVITLMMIRGPSKLITVSVVGLSGGEKEKGSMGIGKSCLCNRST